MGQIHTIASILRRTLILLVISAFCVALLSIIFSDIGAVSFFKLGVRLSTEPVDTDDAGYLEYYEVRDYIDTTKGYRIFIGGDAAGYEAALDFLKFIKQNDEINIIRFETGDAELLNSYLASGDESLLDGAGLDENRLDFVCEIYEYNKLLPPVRKLSFATGSGGGGEFALIEGSYDRSLQRTGILDISCIYPGSEGCDPLFDISSDEIRFGSLSGLSFCTEYLSQVSGNLGMPTFDGINQPEFYFIMGSEPMGSETESDAADDLTSGDGAV